MPGIELRLQDPFVMKEKSRQSWYNQQYSHNDDRFQATWKKKTGEDIFWDDDEQIDDEPNRVLKTVGSWDPESRGRFQ